MSRPYLLLDVDGVVCPFDESEGCDYFPDIGVWISGSMRGHLETLREPFDLVWATLWEHRANDVLADLLGLDPLPVIEFRMPKFSQYGTFKLHSIREFVGTERPFAWIDDDYDWDAEEYAANREVPTLFIKADPKVGMTQEHVDKLLDFAENLSG